VNHEWLRGQSEITGTERRKRVGDDNRKASGTLWPSARDAWTII
jgi:hypothetical protein